MTRPMWAGVGALAVAVVMAVAFPLWQGLDDAWLTVVTGPKEGLVWTVAMVLDFLGRPAGLIVTLAIVLTFLILKRWRGALFFFTGGIVAALVAQVFKHSVDRARPPNPMVIVDHGSFPSGHAVTAAATVMLLVALRVRFAAAAGAAYVVATVWSRTYVHAHWLSDAIAGAVIGLGVALLWWALWKPLLRKEQLV